MNILKSVAGRSKNFWLLEVSSSLQFIASSVTSIFIPIIMLTLGFELLDVILYYILFHFLDLIFNYISVKSIEKFGPKFGYFLGTILIIIFFLLYLFLEGRNWYLLSLMALFSASYDSFYYVAYYYGVMDNTIDIENSKSNNIIVNIASTLSWFIGPLIGAFIILFTENVNILFITTIIILLISLIPLYFCRRNHKVKKADLNFKRYFKDIRNRKNFTSWGLYKISETAESIIFPIFIYLSYKELDSVAFISIIAIFTSLLFTFISGNIQKEKREKVVIIGSIFLILVWLDRIFISNEIYLYLSVALVGIFSLFVQMPIETNIFKHGKELNQLTTAYFKNTIGMGSKLIFYIAIFWLIYLLKSFVIQNTFWLVILSLILLIFINIIYILLKNKK